MTLDAGGAARGSGPRPQEEIGIRDATAPDGAAF